MYIYIINWIIICFLGLLFSYQKKYRKIYLFLCFLIMGLTLGLRAENVGEDTQMYLSIANATKNLSFTEIMREFPKSTWSVDVYGFHNKIETIYLLFNKIIVLITGNSQVVLLIVALVSCYGFAKFIYDNSIDIFISTYVFLCEFFFMFAFNGARQVLAMSIGINSYTNIKKGRYKEALFLIILASLFHQSAIIYLFLYILCAIRNRQKAIKYILFTGIILTQITPILSTIVMKFSPYYATYFINKFWAPSANGIILLWLLEAAMITFIYFNKVKNIDEFVTVACIILYLTIEIIGLKFTVISRVAIYFRVYLMLLFPIFKKYFKNRDKIYYIFLICFILGALYFKTSNLDVRLYKFCF